MKKALRIGAHMSVAGGLPRAIEHTVSYGFSCVQLFLNSPRVWKARDIPAQEMQAFREARRAASIDTVVVHSPYLINLASSTQSIREKSFSALAADVKRADAIGADFYVMHPGSAQEDGIEKGIERVSNALCAIYASHPFRVRFLLENTAGGGTSLGGDFAHIAEVCHRTRQQSPSLPIGVCLDTAHLCAYGYDIAKQEGVARLLRDIQRTITRRRVYVLHANDVRTPCGSRRDHHAHIGKGTVGVAGFTHMMSIPHFRRLPWILETPKDTPECDAMNALRLQKMYAHTREK